MYRELHHNFVAGIVGCSTRGQQQGLCFVVDQQGACVQVFIPLLASLQALGVIGVAVQNAHLQQSQSSGETKERYTALLLQAVKTPFSSRTQHDSCVIQCGKYLDVDARLTHSQGETV